MLIYQCYFLQYTVWKFPYQKLDCNDKGVSKDHKSVLMWQVSEAEATSGASSKCGVDCTVTKGRVLSEHNAWWTVSKTLVRTNSMYAQIGLLTAGTPQGFTGSKEPQREDWMSLFNVQLVDINCELVSFCYDKLLQT